MINKKKKTLLLRFLKNRGLSNTTCVSLAFLVLTSSANIFADFKKREPKADALPTLEVNVKDEPVRQNVLDYVVAKNPEVEDVEEEYTNNAQKLAVILERENITQEQFAEIVATVIGEAAANSYDDAYAVINTFYNRKISKRWINEVLRVTGIDNGDNLYAQITLINQSSVYTSGAYKLYLGITDVPAYQAVIDFLYTLEPMHDYLCFYASYGNIPDSEQFAENGNWYYSLMPSEDRVEELALVREK